MKALLAAGCRVIQFDDPVLLRHPEQAQRWGLKALQACFKGFESQATFIVHICRRYLDKPLEMLGVLDVGSNEVKGMESLVKRGQEALLYLTRNS